MKHVIFILVLLTIPISMFSADFRDWFTTGTMRVDFILAGNAETTNGYLSKIIYEPCWGGPEKNLIDTLNYGDYQFNLHDQETGDLLYSRGLSTLFREWQTTDEAGSLEKAFHNSIRFPYPVKPVKLEIFRRLRDHSLLKITSFLIDPSHPGIEKATLPGYKTGSLLLNGPASTCIDIVILPEGYMQEEMEKFTRDARRLTEHFFEVEPFKTYRNKFNIRLVFAESLESGTDIPGEGVWKNTVLNSNFYTFGCERYLTSPDLWKISDIAAAVPYDQVIILVNSDKYGGGGIYNFYTICTSDNNASPGVMVHEFGHAFAGLGDEYYNSDVAYEDFYDTRFEPWEPNLTTLNNFDKKWKDMVPNDVPVPTPDFLKYAGKTGAFEGGGYQAEGIYRPQIDCIMKNNSYSEYCSVCKRALKTMIFFLTE